ncbi:MAG: hypothetical protein EBZ58_03010 [Bacteroidetes bacterium]|nr:hypothetical protein [Bacteroidota bacterium]
MKWWWSGKESVTMTEKDFFDLLDEGLCSEFVDYLEIVEGMGYYIPFITTMNYLTHPTSKAAFKIKDYSKLKN